MNEIITRDDIERNINRPSCLLTWGKEKPFISIKDMFNHFYVALYLLNLLDSKCKNGWENILLIWQWQLEADCWMKILLDENIWNEFNILTCKLILLGESL